MWATVRDAAAALGVSEDTVRRRMKAGALPSRQDPTRSGFRWLVELPDPAPAGAAIEGAPDSDAAPAAGEVAALRELVAVLERELETRNAELEARQREVQELHILLGRAQGQQLPPQPVAVAPAEPPHTPPQTPGRSPSRRRPIVAHSGPLDGLLRWLGIRARDRR